VFWGVLIERGLADGVFWAAISTQSLDSAVAATLRYCPALGAEPEGSLTALMDFTFNLGAGLLQTSTLRRRGNERAWTAASHEWRRECLWRRKNVAWAGR